VGFLKLVESRYTNASASKAAIKQLLKDG